MGLFSPSSQNPLGIHPGRAEKVRVVMRGSAGVKGNIVYFDLAAADAAVTAAVAFGGATNPTANVLLATGTHEGKDTLTQWLFGILAEDIADDVQGFCYIRGIVQALGGDSANPGVGLKPSTGSELLTSTTETTVVAISLETMANATLKWVIFDGINKFPYNGSTT